MKTFKFHTLGCKVNQYETQLMREQLLKYGLKEINPETPADLYIINTCTVTTDADRESRRLIRHSMKKNPDAAIIAAGCYVEKDADVIKAIDNRIILLTNKDKKEIIEKLVPGTNFFMAPLFITHFKDHTKAFIKIQDGCDNFCSYCKVPYVRGAPKSREKDEIIQGAKALLKNNYKELVLTGVCLGAYGKDSNGQVSLTDILTAISDLHGDFRIRLSSIEMQDITDELIDIIKTRDNICNHLHIPLQSGDDEILKKMNRRYSAAEFIERIEQIKEAIPGIAISIDVIVGFPGEDDNAFENTLKCVQEIEPMRAHIFPYSKREGTASYSIIHNRDNNKIAERYSILKKLTNSLAQSYYNYTRHTPQRILVENTINKSSNKLCGYTDTYIRLTLEGPDEWMGKFVYTPLSRGFSPFQR